jgi:hypothetical protein
MEIMWTIYDMTVADISRKKERVSERKKLMSLQHTLRKKKH